LERGNQLEDSGAEKVKLKQLPGYIEWICPGRYMIFSVPA
jgi:hypothetical protein